MSLSIIEGVGDAIEKYQWGAYVIVIWFNMG